jgi:D-alanyl-lipoteichoic acid acyltransferase DltB (MBOAT superfamily)
MVFSSTLFLFLFLPLVLIGYYQPMWKSRVFRNVWLLLSSLGFYAWGEPLFVFAMLLSIVINWALVRLMDRQASGSARKAFMVSALVWDVALLFVFKYASFVAKNIALFSHSNATLNIALPIGISFFTFQIMSYVLDVYWRKAPAERNFINVALYVSLFPQLIAGPIVRYETVAAEITGRKETLADFGAGFTRFVIGLSKKLLIANYAGFIADKIFDAATGGSALPLSVASAWLGAAAYTLQIYFDFSAYSDMAIGLGRMFGFHFLENFRYPYCAVSITDFWRRWHISLSTWFRDYVYIPAGGNRGGAGATVRNMALVWILTGVWHGANWTFVAWGAFYFVLLVIERATGFAKRLPVVVCRVYTMVLVMLAWVLFRSPTITDALHYIGTMFGTGAGGFIDDTFRLYAGNGKWVLLAGVLLSTPLFPLIQKRFGGGKAYSVASSVCVAALFTLSVMLCIKSTYNPFLYFNF